jgi:hypothetical protein
MDRIHMDRGHVHGRIEMHRRGYMHRRIKVTAAATEVAAAATEMATAAATEVDTAAAAAEMTSRGTGNATEGERCRTGKHDRSHDSSLLHEHSKEFMSSRPQIIAEGQLDKASVAKQCWNKLGRRNSASANRLIGVDENLLGS